MPLSKAAAWISMRLCTTSRALSTVNSTRRSTRPCLVRRHSSSSSDNNTTEDPVEPLQLDEADCLRRNLSIDEIKELPAVSTDFLLHPTVNDKWKVVRLEHLALVAIPSDWDAELAAFERRIGIQFQDSMHLKCALIHHGAISQSSAQRSSIACRLSNRSLEFLGDSLLGMAAASYLFQSCPLFQEGQLTSAKSAIVNNHTLSKICREVLQIHEQILVASAADLAISAAALPSQVDQLEQARRTIEAGVVEALIGAVYLDQGVDVALTFINEKILPHAVRFAGHHGRLDVISEFQRLIHSLGFSNPEFRKVPAPPTQSHRTIKVMVDDTEILRRSASSYQKAKRKASKASLEVFSSLREDPAALQNLSKRELVAKAVALANRN